MVLGRVGRPFMGIVPGSGLAWSALWAEGLWSRFRSRKRGRSDAVPRAWSPDQARSSSPEQSDGIGSAGIVTRRAKTAQGDGFVSGPEARE